MSMSCNCCSPYVYVWLNPSFEPSRIASRPDLGRGVRSVTYSGMPPLIGTGGTTIPRKGDWVFVAMSDYAERQGYGILADGSLWGWGPGPLGDGTTNPSTFPKKISSERWKKVATCLSHTLAIKEDGTLWFWGEPSCSGAAYASADPTCRAILDSSVESIRTVDVSLTSAWYEGSSQANNMQPSDVEVASAPYGTGAIVSCEIFYAIEYVFDAPTATPPGVFSSPPTVEIVPDPRDTDASPAQVKTTIDAAGYVDSVSVVSGGRYKYLPTVTFVGTRPGGGEYRSSPCRLNLASQEVSLSVVNGGSGYTHKIDNQIKIWLNFPNKQRKHAGYAVLSPSRVKEIKEAFGTCSTWNGAILASDINVLVSYPYPQPSSEVVYEFDSVVPTAWLVSYADEDVPLTVTRVTTGGNFRIALGSSLYDRKDIGLIRIDWPAFTYSPKPYKGGGENGFVFIGGSVSPPAVGTQWSVVDEFARGTAVACGSTKKETYVPYNEDPQLTGGFYAGRPYTPQGAYQSGPPLRPLVQSIPSPAYSYSQHFPAVTEWRDPRRPSVLQANMNFQHFEKTFVPPVTVLVYSNNVGGGGCEISVSWEKTRSQPLRDTHTARFSVDNPGEGYIYEPTVIATALVLSPIQVGSRSDWEDICCVRRGSAGIAGGLLYAWGGEIESDAIGTWLSATRTPTQVGFGLNVNYSSEQDSPFDLSYPFLGAGAFSSPAMKPQTRGDPGIAGSVIYHSHSARFAAETPVRVGATAGLYESGSFPPAVSALLPDSFGGFQAFVPYQYNRDNVRPMPTWTNKFVGLSFPPGPCYTHAPTGLGYGLTATLNAPSSFRRIFINSGCLWGVSSENDLWWITGEWNTLSTSTPHRPFTESDKVMTKAWKAEKSIKWTWDTEEEEVTFVGAYYDMPGGKVTSYFDIGSFDSTYILPPTEEVTGDAGYVNAISVYPAESYKLVITNPGSGYKTNDALTFTLTGGKAPGFKRVHSFGYSGHESETVDTTVGELYYEARSPRDGLWYPVRQINWAASRYGYGGAWPRRPYGRPLVYAEQPGGDTRNPSVETESVARTYLKSVTCQLVDKWDSEEVLLPDVQFQTALYAIADGGVYMMDEGDWSFQAPNSNTLHLGKNLPAFGPYGSWFSSPTWTFPIKMFSKIPSVVITGGSGSGAEAILVPIDSRLAAGIESGSGPQIISRPPYNCSKGLTNNGVSLKDAGFPYAIGSDGKLKSYENPLVQLPETYPSGFEKISPGIGLTESGNLYDVIGGEAFLHTGYSFAPPTRPLYSSKLRRPTAVPNVEFFIDEPGEDYTSPPLVTVDQPTEDIAVVDAVLDGKLVSLGIDNPGRGYRTAPTLELIGGDGSGAEAVAVISGPVERIDVTASGAGYKAAPNVVFPNAGVFAKATAAASGFVDRIVVADTGDGYSSQPTVSISGGATATAVMKKRVRSIKITARGGLYDSPPTVTVAATGDVQAKAEPVVRYNPSTKKYYIVSIRVTDKGDGYTSTPAVTVTSEEAASVTAVAVMDEYVHSINVTSGGSGYTSPPAVTITGRCITPCQASSLLSMHVDSISVTEGGKYRSAPQVSIEPSGTVLSITVSSGGAGYNYKKPPQVHVIDTRGLGTGAAASCRVNREGEVSEVIVTSCGSGYDPEFPPRVLFSGGGGTGASATASVEKANGGAEGECFLNGSILYAKVTQPGGGYQFSPKVKIRGGGNVAAEELDRQLGDGEISQEAYDEKIAAERGVIQARIEGTISRFDIINPGNWYSTYSLVNSVPVQIVPPGKYDGRWDFGHTAYMGYYSDGSADPVGMKCVTPKALVDGVVVQFGSSSSYPGGPITQPSAMPTAKFQQKPKVLFVNSMSVDVQEFVQATQTSAGMRERKTASDPYVFGYCDSTAAADLTVPGGSLRFVWRDILSGRDITGLSGMRFESGKEPSLRLRSSGGAGARSQLSLDSDGYVTSASWSESGSGYSYLSTAEIEGGILRHTECIAECVVSQDGRLVAINVTVGGGGYMIPKAIVHGGRGSGAIVEPIRTMDDIVGSITRVNVVSEGSGYDPANPPSVLVYESAGLLSSSVAGAAINESLSKLSYQDSQSVIKSTTWESEYAMQDSSLFVSKSDRLDFWGTLLEKDGKPLVDAFGYLKTASNLTCNLRLRTGNLMRFPYSSPPTVTVRGDCKRQMVVSSAIAKWTDIFSNPRPIKAYSLYLSRTVAALREQP